MADRKARVERNTLETQITVSLNLDGSGKSGFDTGVPFLEHMMEQIARHGLIDLEVKAKGICGLMITTPLRISASRWVRRWPRRWVIRRGLLVTGIPMCRWMRRCRVW